MKFRSKNREKRRIDMTPMIDCVFQLLLFFLVASHFEEEAQSMEQSVLDSVLPEAAAAMPLVAQPQEITISIDMNGRFFLGRQQRSEIELSDFLERSQNNNPGRMVIIRGDERADWKYVARVMSLCNKANITNYKVAVVPEALAVQ
ncbi:MAG: biopolymer transporter ExbD [Planctomycetaceae bacterium]|nr:biopolymer transporter ExbD [Planctomycetaceae bacterium]